jgi:hypothetical protein
LHLTGGGSPCQPQVNGIATNLKELTGMAFSHASVDCRQYFTPQVIAVGNCHNGLIDHLSKMPSLCPKRTALSYMSISLSGLEVLERTTRSLLTRVAEKPTPAELVAALQNNEQSPPHSWVGCSALRL